jgi:hypothetical protein
MAGEYYVKNWSVNTSQKYYWPKIINCDKGCYSETAFNEKQNGKDGIVKMSFNN